MVAPKQHITKDMTLTVPGSLQFVLKSAQDQYHASLLELSQAAPTLILFLRHFGCCFCREALADIHASLPALEAERIKIVLVHMASDEEASTFLASYGLADLSRISSPDQGLYKAFGLGRASANQLLTPQFWARGLQVLCNGHMIGLPVGNGLQMPGIFLIHKGKIVKSFRHSQASDRVNYLNFAICSTPEI